MKKVKKLVKKIVKKPIKKPVKRIVKKVKLIAVPKVVVNVEIPTIDYIPQDEKYWTERPLDDSHKDWNYEGSWVDGYSQSKDHPHRKLIIEALEKLQPFNVVGEIGCNVGPNLKLIQERFGGVSTKGIDASPIAVEKAPSYLNIELGSLTRLPWDTKNIDVLISDAVLLYVSPQEIDRVMNEIDRVTKKAVILVERGDSSVMGEVRGHTWARNYSVLLEKLGFKVSVKQLTKELWPGSPNWAKFGIVVSAVR